MPLSTPLFPPSLSRMKTQLDTSSDKATAIYSAYVSCHWVHSSIISLIDAVSALLLQHVLYHSSKGLITTAYLVTAAAALALQVSSFLLQAAPLLLKYNPCGCSTSLITACEALLLHCEPFYYYYLKVFSL